MFSPFYLFISQKKRTFALVIELDRHIEILLLNNDCVIVPDLGGFMAHHVEARYDTEDGTFLPPLRTLGFNPQLKMNDSLLVQSYIEAYDISYPEALRRIEAEVAEINQHLETKSYFELNDIGMLRLNEEGHITFEPCEAGILTPSLYGLSSFEMPLIAANEEQTAEETASADIVSINNKEAKAEDEESITIKMSWLRNVAAVAAAVVAFLMIGSPISNSDPDDQIQQSAFFPVKSIRATSQVEGGVSIVTTESAQQKNANDSITAKAEKTVNASEEKVEVSATTYCIVLASHVSKPNATEFVNQLNKKGYPEARLLETTILRVVYGSYASENDARNTLKALRSQNELFTEAWIMKVK